ncbi:MAG: SufD family Fe-S cluster assembly protein [Armatimonadetes bacterium]|nr:SufD family Fe-S cluster assembly protein [Armatimonadota bacterium]
MRFHQLKSTEPSWVREYEAMLEALKQAGGDPSAITSGKFATLVVSANKVLAKSEIPGIHFEAEEIPTGIQAHIFVEPKAKIHQPVHLCFGMLTEEGIQEIIAHYEIGEDAQVAFFAHCTFPNAQDLKHLMEATIHVGKNARMSYTESHYHGPYGGIEVKPHAKVIVEEGGKFMNNFNLIHGRVGVLEIDYEVDVAKEGVAELVARVYGVEDDRISIKEFVRLNGERARGLTKTRVAVRSQAISEVFTTMEGNAPYAKGHMDCTEIVQDNAIAKNMPLVVVRDNRAQVTHEAAIGTVNRKELETLMARGLSEDEAVDIIIRGMLQWI